MRQEIPVLVRDYFFLINTPSVDKSKLLIAFQSPMQDLGYDFLSYYASKKQCHTTLLTDLATNSMTLFSSSTYILAHIIWAKFYTLTPGYPQRTTFLKRQSTQYLLHYSYMNKHLR